jgi:glycosyltransferase involved in cell wall biosynthesis
MNDRAVERKPCVLIVQRSAALDGSAHSGLLLADGLREAGWDTHAAFGFEGPIIERYAAAGHETHVLPHDNWLRRHRTHQFAKDVWLEWRKASIFNALIEEVQADLVYLNTVVSLAGAVAARRQGVPCVWHLREMFADVGGEMRAPSWAVPLVRRIIRAHADRIVANSTATARNVLAGSEDGVDVIPNAVRAPFFEEERTQEDARAVFSLSRDGPIVGVPGTLRPMKGHPFLFDAAASVLRERENLQVAVTGDGDGEFVAQLKRQVDELGIADRVHFLGWVKDMPAFYRACDLVCIPSRAEPFGRTAIEAFATGTPVIATAVGGLQEIVTDGETGRLVPYGDEEALAAAVQQSLERPALRRKMANHARQVAEEKYHERVYKNRIGEVVASVKERGRAPTS